MKKFTHLVFCAIQAIGKREQGGVRGENFMAKILLALSAIMVSLGAFSEEQFIIKHRGKTPFSRMVDTKMDIRRSGNFADSFPDDEHGGLQWNLQAFSHDNLGTSNASTAWAHFGTGGQDARGNDIVVAVIDIGFDLSHEDLVENLFINHGEIPNNGKDDDGNGYVDDVTGWSTRDMPIDPSSHGAIVAGIIGARGNNGVGVVGVNWKVKILPIQVQMGIPYEMQTSEVAKAYTYVMNMKRRWLLSNGKEGANIVVTNSSFGINGKKCFGGDSSIWNDLYDEMGELGILAAVATANEPFDVDEYGDVPSNCSSDYIISVTSIKQNGEMEETAGWGVQSVDLAAPGVNILSTVSFDDSYAWYEFHTGTSMATPHVAGAIAYLYSVASKSFIESYYSHPGVAALKIKRALLESAGLLEALEGKVATGGVLDIYEAALVVAQL